MAEDSGVKAEAKSEVKLESPSAMEDVEQYVDDNHDLQIADDRQSWLINVPKPLWETWNEMYKDANVGDEIVVGQLRVYNAPDADLLQQKIQIHTSERTKRSRADLASGFTLELKTNGYNNTAVFSEKDLPGHRSQQLGGRFARPTGVQSKADRYARRPGGYRSAIPKKAALVPVINHEAVAVPILNDTYDDLAQAFKAEADRTSKVNFDRDQFRRIQPGALSAQPLFQFGSLSSKPKGNKKAAKEKAVRMERTVLLDQLQRLFAEYSYWKLGGLKARLNQPEAYIKQTLEEIAILVKQGDFANTYKLKPEYESLARVQAAGNLRQEVAPEDEEVGSDGTGDEMDDDEDFEDVMDMKATD